jgi:UDP-N-acetylmuramoylalanine--D-glutamate ligase
MPPTAPPFLLPLLARPVAVFGDGLSGRGALELLQAVGAEGAVYDAGGAAFSPEAARRHRLAVFSPGFPPDHPWLEAARSAGCECVGELDFAGLFWRGGLVAVTGTNGKTTLVEFLASALEPAGRRAVAAGNIGRAFSKIVAETGGGAGMTAVCEVSSFQAETLRRLRPDAVLWTNFAEDHLERHGTLEAYFAAKANLAARSKRVFAGSSVKAFADARGGLFGPRKDDSLAIEGRDGSLAIEGRDGSPSRPFFSGRLFASLPVDDGHPLSSPLAPLGAKALSALARSVGEPSLPPETTWVATEAQPPDAALEGTAFSHYPQRENFLLGEAWWRAEGLDGGLLREAARRFRTGRHRLEKVAEVAGVAYWDDSKATNFHAVEAALSGFASPVLLIAGGRSKGGDIPGFVRRISPKVRRVFLIGETGPELARACGAARLPFEARPTLAEAVRGAAESARPGEHVLLSPGFASFDMFRSYEERGERFAALVRDLAPVRAAHLD